MPRAIGIDPGTLSFDLCGLEGDRLFLDKSIATREVTSNPRLLLEAVQAVGPVDMIIGPSGYGLPWVKARDLTPRQMDRMLLSQRRTQGRNTIIGGLHKLLCVLKESGLPITFAPGVIHLSSVPAHRKVNRIDMGTADKLCAVALGIYDQSRKLNIGYEETSFVYVELGGAFTAIVGVEKGKVVDGLGGTSGAMGYLSLGAMDGELAYLLGAFPKELLCSGGVAYIAGQQDLAPEALMSLPRFDQRWGLAWEAFMESVVKAVAAELSVITKPREIFLSGRLCRVPNIRQEVVRRLRSFAPVRRVEGFARTAKEAAQGAALIAEGLAGGKYRHLVEVMDLRRAGGDILDHLCVADAETLRRKF